MACCYDSGKRKKTRIFDTRLLIVLKRVKIAVWQAGGAPSLHRLER